MSKMRKQPGGLLDQTFKINGLQICTCSLLEAPELASIIIMTFAPKYSGWWIGNQRKLPRPAKTPISHSISPRLQIHETSGTIHETGFLKAEAICMATLYFGLMF